MSINVYDLRGVEIPRVPCRQCEGKGWRLSLNPDPVGKYHLCKCWTCAGSGEISALRAGIGFTRLNDEYQQNARRLLWNAYVEAGYPGLRS